MEKIDLIYRKKETFSEFNSGNDLLEPKLRKKIRLSVLGVHFGFLLILVLWYLITNFFISKKPTVIQVTLLTPDAAPVFSPTPPTPAKPTPPAVKPKKRKPKPTPKKPTFRPKPKPKSKPKRKWKPMSADDIKISKTVIKNDPTPTPRALSAKDLESKLKNSFLKNRVTTTTKKGTQGTQISQNYFEKISALMYQSWQQPGQSELRGKYPVVDVEITVNGSGKILKSRIVRKSGVAVMDQSAQKLLRELRRLPRPPSGKTTFTVSLEIVRD